MNKFILRLARYIISRIPKGKSILMRLALSIAGTSFKDIIAVKDGRKFYIDNISLVKRHLFFLNEYETIETDIITKVIKPGDYVFDVGANFGWFTTLMSRLVGDAGKVYAFELAPNIAQECQRNIKLNHAEKNVILEDIALGDVDQNVEYIYSESLGLANLRTDGLQGAGTLHTASGRMTSLDHYIEKNAISKVNLIKCDVDGAEVIFLKGARDTISRHLPVIVIEASGEHGRSSSHEIFEELSKYNYKFFSLHHKSRLRPIAVSDFYGRFKSNILCLPLEKISLLKSL